MADLYLDNIYVENSNPWEELIKANCKVPEKLLSSTNSLNNLSSSKTKFNLKSSIKLNKEIEDNKVVTIDEIVNLKLEEIKLTKILEYQYVITKHLKNNLKNINECREELVKKIYWLRDSTNYLSEKFNLDKVQIKKTNDTNVIHRSSYKFCKYNYKCKYLYKDNTITNNCFEQHIVFNYLYLDIDNLINYLDNNTEYDMNEIQKCINTIYFVVNHIKEELENLRDVNNCNFDNLKITKKK